VVEEHPTLETSSSEKDRSLEVLRAMFKRTRLMIIKLRKYNEIRELLIENRTTGSQAHLSYWDGDANRAQGHIQSASKSGSRTSMHMSTAEQSESISMQKDRNRLENKEVGTLRSRSTS